jgi:hypothetical protein
MGDSQAKARALGNRLADELGHPSILSKPIRKILLAIGTVREGGKVKPPLNRIPQGALVDRFICTRNNFELWR